MRGLSLHSRLRLLGGAVAVATSLLAGLVLYSAVELERFERAEARRASVVYAAGQRLVPGLHPGRVGLAATLGRLGYAETRATPVSPGQFRRGAEAWDIFLRGSEASGRPARVRLFLSGERVARLTRDGAEAAGVALEPEALASAGTGALESHRPVRLAEVPPALVEAVLAAEDHRFFAHGGLDAIAVLRAAWANLRAASIVQGGSTITQQLVRARLLSPRRSFLRKLREAWLAALVEWRYSKGEILEAYLDEVYLGQRGAMAIHGVGAGARAHFGKEVHQLTPAEAALLAGMVQAPNRLSPALHPDRARARRDVVLARMQALGMLDDAGHRRARREPVRARRASTAGHPGPYFLDHVREELGRRFGRELGSASPVRVETTLDLALQRFAETAVARGLDRLETSIPGLRRREDSRRLQAALIALDPASGEILALVGGRDHGSSQFNRATLARRQPGSAFKPFVYLAALRPGGDRPPLTAASLVDDAPITRMVDGRMWSPRNHEDRYEGRVTLRRALEQSLNAATVQVAEAAGLPAVVATARALGLGGNLAPVPALALGAFEVTPLELALAYAPLASGGVRPPGPITVRAVIDPDGPVEAPRGTPGQVISPAEAYLVTSMLQGVMTSGTAAGVRPLGPPGSVAGKTGTSNEGRDAWFVGYTPALLALVWVGFDEGEPPGLSGARAALPIWADFMRSALDAYAHPPFAAPADVVFVDVDPTTGKAATGACPSTAREAFIRGTEPLPCAEHRGVVDDALGWWRRIWRWLPR